MEYISVATLAVTGLLGVERVNKYTDCLHSVRHLRSSCCGVNISLSRRNSNGAESPTALNDIKKTLEGISQRTLNVPPILEIPTNKL
jgi:hypothetical protein